MTQITTNSNLIDLSAYGLSNLITPEAFGARADGDPAHNDLPYIQEALNSGAKIVFCPGKYYCDGEGQLVIPDGVLLIGNYRNTLISPGEATFQINAHKGVYDKTLGFFKMGLGSAVRNISAFYPEQTKTDNRSSIVEFPPLFYCNNYAGIIDGVHADKVYSFLEGDGIPNLDMSNVHAFCIYRGIQLFGFMGDVSSFSNVEMIMNGGVAWGTNITDWCQRHAIGLSLVPAGLESD